MEITSVCIRKTYTKQKEPALRAFADVVFDNEFVVKGFKVIEGRFNRFVDMPGRERPDGLRLDMAHPINEKMRDKLSNAVLGEYFKHINGKQEAR